MILSHQDLQQRRRRKRIFGAGFLPSKSKTRCCDSITTILETTTIFSLPMMVAVIAILLSRVAVATSATPTTTIVTKTPTIFTISKSSPCNIFNCSTGGRRQRAAASRVDVSSALSASSPTTTTSLLLPPLPETSTVPALLLPLTTTIPVVLSRVTSTGRRTKSSGIMFIDMSTNTSIALSTTARTSSSSSSSPNNSMLSTVNNRDTDVDGSTSTTTIASTAEVSSTKRPGLSSFSMMTLPAFAASSLSPPSSTSTTSEEEEEVVVTTGVIADDNISSSSSPNDDSIASDTNNPLQVIVMSHTTTPSSKSQTTMTSSCATTTSSLLLDEESVMISIKPIDQPCDDDHDDDQECNVRRMLSSITASTTTLLLMMRGGSSPDSNNAAQESQQQQFQAQDKKTNDQQQQQPKKLAKPQQKPRKRRRGLLLPPSLTVVSRRSTSSSSTNSNAFTGGQGQDFSLQQQPISSPQLRPRVINLNIMVAGLSGLGKTTMCNSLISSWADKKNSRQQHAEAELEEENDDPIITTTHKTKYIDDTSRIYQRYDDQTNTILRVRIIDTPGFGNRINHYHSIKPISNYIKKCRLRKYKHEMSPITRTKTARNSFIHAVKRTGSSNVDDEDNNIPYTIEDDNDDDKLVHLCVYFVSPGRLLEIDKLFLKQIQKETVIVPIIAKADTLTDQEIAIYRQYLKRKFKKEGIRIYNFDSSPTRYAYYRGRRYGELFAIISRNGNYPWGHSFKNNINHSDLPLLRDLLLSEHLEKFIESATIKYYQYRSTRLARIQIIDNMKYLLLISLMTIQLNTIPSINHVVYHTLSSIFGPIATLLSRIQLTISFPKWGKSKTISMNDGDTTGGEDPSIRMEGDKDGHTSDCDSSNDDDNVTSSAAPTSSLSTSPSPRRLGILGHYGIPIKFVNFRNRK